MTNLDAPSAYELDIQNQLTAVKDQLAYTLPATLQKINLADYDRIIFTGMGSSDYALIPLERALIARGLPVWRVDAGRLMDMPSLITPNTLLWATSQSGMSGEVVAAIDGSSRPRTLVGVTNNMNSRLAEAADIVISLHSGDEATVSSKSYLNTLIANYRALYAVIGQAEGPLLASLHQLLPEIGRRIGDSAFATGIAQHLLGHARPRLALIGIGADAANALTGALITKEASKVSAEGFIGGEFRHGPMETSGDSMTALLMGDGTDATLHQLAADLLANGTRVITLGPVAYAGSELLPTAGDSELTRLLCGMITIEHLTVALARANGMIPGHFLFGQKITVKI